MTYAKPIFKYEAKDIMKNWVDPEAKAEAERYDNPIPSRTLILNTLEQVDTPFRMPNWSIILKSKIKKVLML
jgi:hypothetical protein